MRKLLIMGLVAFAACTGQSEEDECASDECLKQQAYDKVIAVHDEVMPKLGQIADLKQKLEEKTRGSIDSLKANQYIKLMQDLDAADESMMTWMRAFKSDIEALPIDSALSYLEAEQAKVDRVAENINSSIAAAEEALN